jgi:primosomal protein N'
VKTPECPVHHIPMEMRPSELQARCTHCGYTTSHPRFDRCRECGKPLHIVEPEPRWHCPRCAPEKEPASAGS